MTRLSALGVGLSVAMPRPPVAVLLTRISPGTRPMDDDNLPGAMKAIRDEVAAMLGIDDGDRTAARWEYGQERGAWGVRVEIRALRSHPADCDDVTCCPMGGVR